MANVVPTHIKLLQKDRLLIITFNDGCCFELPCAFLRSHSPSAETRRIEDRTELETVKSDINIIAIEPVGNYAIKLIFDDGHDTGLYSWELLYELGKKLENHPLNQFKK